ncbi:hypothetical protein C8R44DRAFT_740909 [Mycena epipterygia]|nr:hypothetical protein C8R44DRAFT_740909 [Mycena epipterygia]
MDVLIVCGDDSDIYSTYGVVTHPTTNQTWTTDGAWKPAKLLRKRGFARTREVYVEVFGFCHARGRRSMAPYARPDGQRAQCPGTYHLRDVHGCSLASPPAARVKNLKQETPDPSREAGFLAGSEAGFLPDSLAAAQPGWFRAKRLARDSIRTRRIKVHCSYRVPLLIRRSPAPPTTTSGPATRVGWGARELWGAGELLRRGIHGHALRPDAVTVSNELLSPSIALADRVASPLPPPPSVRYPSCIHPSILSPDSTGIVKLQFNLLFWPTPGIHRRLFSLSPQLEPTPNLGVAHAFLFADRLPSSSNLGCLLVLDLSAIASSKRSSSKEANKFSKLAGHRNNHGRLGSAALDDQLRIYLMHYWACMRDFAGSNAVTLQDETRCNKSLNWARSYRALCSAPTFGVAGSLDPDSSNLLD